MSKATKIVLGTVGIASLISVLIIAGYAFA